MQLFALILVFSGVSTVRVQPRWAISRRCPSPMMPAIRSVDVGIEDMSTSEKVQELEQLLSSSVLQLEVTERQLLQAELDRLKQETGPVAVEATVPPPTQQPKMDEAEVQALEESYEAEVMALEEECDAGVEEACVTLSIEREISQAWLAKRAKEQAIFEEEKRKWLAELNPTLAAPIATPTAAPIIAPTVAPIAAPIAEATAELAAKPVAKPTPSPPLTEKLVAKELAEKIVANKLTSMDKEEAIAYLASRAPLQLGVEKAVVDEAIQMIRGESKQGVTTAPAKAKGPAKAKASPQPTPAARATASPDPVQKKPAEKLMSPKGTPSSSPPAPVIASAARPEVSVMNVGVVASLAVIASVVVVISASGSAGEDSMSSFAASLASVSPEDAIVALSSVAAIASSTVADAVAAASSLLNQ